MSPEKMLFDEQVSEMFQILSDVVMLQMKANDPSRRITKGEIFRLKDQLTLLPKLRKACNHYPVVKQKIFITAKNLLLNLID